MRYTFALVVGITALCCAPPAWLAPILPPFVNSPNGAR
jgi:hypothetical protein